MTKVRNREDFDFTGSVPLRSARNRREDITVATDAAVDFGIYRAASGFLADCGYYGLAGHPQPPGIVGSEAVAVAELRASWRAVSTLARYERTKVVILTDSANALDYLQAWKSGEDVFPAGYQLYRQSGRPSSLRLLAEQLRYDGGQYAFAKVAAHAGHALNEAADSLARLALRAGGRRGLTAEQAQSAAATIASARLADWKAR